VEVSRADGHEHARHAQAVDMGSRLVALAGLVGASSAQFICMLHHWPLLPSGLDKPGALGLTTLATPRNPLSPDSNEVAVAISVLSRSQSAGRRLARSHSPGAAHSAPVWHRGWGWRSRRGSQGCNSSNEHPLAATGPSSGRSQTPSGPWEGYFRNDYRLCFSSSTDSIKDPSTSISS
jgi:hypothetical protein